MSKIIQMNTGQRKQRTVLGRLMFSFADFGRFARPDIALNPTRGMMIGFIERLSIPDCHVSVRVAIKSAQISCYGIEQHDLSPFSVYCHSRRDRDLTFAFALHFKSLGYAPGMKQAIMPPPHFQVVVLLVFKILFAQ